MEATYEKAEIINKEVEQRWLARYAPEWEKGVAAAAARGRFPKGVEMEVVSKPPDRLVEYWSTSKYRVSVEHHREWPDSHFPTIIKPERWGITLQPVLDTK